MLPDEVAADGAPVGSRYDHMIRLFGQKFVEEKIMNARTFMVIFALVMIVDATLGVQGRERYLRLSC